MATTKRKRLVQGEDWHAWAWKAGKDWPRPGELFHFAESKRPKSAPDTTGQWVRVKFVEVKGA